MCGYLPYIVMARAGSPDVKDQEINMIASPSRIVIRVILTLLLTRSRLSATSDRSTGGICISFCDSGFSVSVNGSAPFNGEVKHK